MQKAKQAFTLVEMLVVIGILGLLIGVLIVSMSGSTESARAASCLANLKSLASACHSYGVATTGIIPQYPLAGAEVWYQMVKDGNTDRASYLERKGWISWKSKGAFPATSPSSCEPISMFTDNLDDATYALTNGSLWRYVSANSRVYVCPTHATRVSPVHWSYLMNATFGWDANNGATAFSSKQGFVPYGGKIPTYNAQVGSKSRSPDRVLLFGEVPFMGPGSWFPSGTTGSMDTDCTLQFEGCDKIPSAPVDGARNGTENIGANHKVGKYWCAHVVYGDGHVEKVRVGKADDTKVDGTMLKKLTTYLCTGVDFSINGSKLELLED